MAYTNKTANYELPQYVPTDEPTYLEDFNGAMFTIDSGMKENSNNIGDLSSLTTTDKSSLVSAINELASSGGACKLHLLDVSSYGINNPLYFDSLELGSYVLYDSRQNYGGNSEISITFKGKAGSPGSATVSTYEGAILNYFIDVNNITDTSKYFARCSLIGSTSSAPSLCYFAFRLSNTSTGRIDYDSLNSVVLTYDNKTNIANNYNSSAIQYLKNENGTLNWVAEANVTPSMIYLGKINLYNSASNALDLSSYVAGTRIVLKHNDSSRSFYIKVGSKTAQVPVTTDNDTAIVNNIYYVDINSISGATANISVTWASTYEWCPLVTNNIMVNFTSGGSTVGNTTRSMQVFPYFQMEEDSSGNLNTTTLQQFIYVRESGITKTKAQQRTAIQYIDKDKNSFILTYKSRTAGSQQIYEGTGIMKTASANGLYEAYRVTLEINYSGLTYSNYQLTKTNLGYVFDPTAITGYSPTGTKTLGLNNGALEWV